MGIADIQEKQSEERKREKRLVHFTNAVTRDFLDSKYVKSKTKTTRELVEYMTKSFLDYLFFDEHREIRELYEEQVIHFMQDFAPRKLKLDAERAKEGAVILADFLSFLEDQGHIHNGNEMGADARKKATAFSKLFPNTLKKKIEKKNAAGARKIPARSAKKQDPVTRGIGRNDPCPCGSGKKYKKCCGKTA